MACTTQGLGLPQLYNLKSRLARDTWPGIVFTLIVNEEPLDLTDCIVAMTFIKATRVGGTEWLLTNENEAIAVEDNVITVLPRLLTLAPGKYAYDLQVTFPDDTVRTYVQGSFEVLKDITL